MSVVSLLVTMTNKTVVIVKGMDSEQVCKPYILIMVDPKVCSSLKPRLFTWILAKSGTDSLGLRLDM